MTTDFWLGFGSGTTAMFVIFVLSLIAVALDRRWGR